MKIGVIQASSQAGKNRLLYETVKEFAKGHYVCNFGCFADESENYTYIEISIMIGMLLASGSLDFIVTGCSSGQGMMLACNSMPGIICGYAPTGKDAYLFAQINDGNAVSLPLGEEYTWQGIDNFRNTLEMLFSEPFGQGYPKMESERKLRDTQLLKIIRGNSQIGMIDFLDKLDSEIINKILSKKEVVDWIIKNSTDTAIVNWIISYYGD